MADLIHFKTVPTQNQNLFYKVTSGGLSFLVKTESSASVGLVSAPDRDFAFKVVIEPFKCSLVVGHDDEVTARLNEENFITGNEFKKFWIFWRKKVIAFGTGRTVLLSYRSENDIPQPNYVTFYTDIDSNLSTQWQFYVSPVIEDLPLKPMSDGEPHWVRVEDQLPDGALIGGFENEFLYIMRAHWRYSLTPGKFVPSLGLGFIPWGGNSHECDTLEILCGYNCTWVPVHDNTVPIDAIEGGYSEVDAEDLYVGRVHYKGHLIVGKIQPSHRCCYFPYDDRELSAEKYEVLVVPRKKYGTIASTDHCF